MSSYTSTDSYLARMDSEASSSSTSRIRSNSLFENPPMDLATQGRRRSQSLSESNSHSPISPPTPHRSRPTRYTTNNPVVQAMITSNNLRNCREVEEMVFRCMNNKDNESSFVCKTAQRYIGRCQK